MLQLGLAAELPQTRQQLEVNADLLLEHVRLEDVDAVGVVRGEDLGDEGVVLCAAVGEEAGVDLAGGAHVARAHLAVLQLQVAQLGRHRQRRLGVLHLGSPWSEDTNT